MSHKPTNKDALTNRSSRLEPACLYPLHAGVGLSYSLQGLGKGEAGEPWAAGTVMHGFSEQRQNN